MKRFIIFGPFLVLILSLALFEVIYYGSEDYVITTVTGKEVVVTGDSESTDSKYLIFTEDEVFENEDLFWKWKFDSSDLQNKVKVGETYKMTVYGWRVPFFSSYRCIYNAEPVEVRNEYSSEVNLSK